MTMAPSDKSKPAVEKGTGKAAAEDKANRKRESSSSSTEADTNKRVRTELVDRAVEMGFKAGDRFEVQWEVVNKDNNEEMMHWWGATLMEHDGRSEEGIAIRTLDYDPYPEGGFLERSKEDCVFVTSNTLYGVEIGELTYRKEGEEATLAMNSQEVVDVILQNALAKNSGAWKKLTAAQQASVADIISTGKERLQQAIQTQWDAKPDGNKVLNGDDAKEILEKAFHDM